MTVSLTPAKLGAYNSSVNRRQLDLKIDSALSEASRTVEQVGDWLAKENVAPEKIGDITLVLAESLNNVVEHAYGADLDGPIEVLVDRRGSTVSMQIVDDGTPFDGPPEEVALVTDGREVADMPESGFGWFLIKTLTEDIHFAHVDGKNKLTLVVSL